MTTYLETKLANSSTPEIRYGYDLPISTHVEMAPSWQEGQLPISVSATGAFVKTDSVLRYGEGFGFGTDVFGVGQSTGPTLSILDFVGEQGWCGEASDEFEFTGLGLVRSLGEPTRDVPLQGVGRYIGSETPFVRHFYGHAVVDERYAWSNMPTAYQVRGVVERPPRRRARQSSPSRAYKVFKELATWLEMADDELAKIVDVSRTTVSMSWKKGVEPHNKAKARRLYELHSVVSALRQILGPELTGWLKRGRPCPLTLLEQKKYERFERCADAVIFPTPDEPRRRLDTAREPRGDDTPPVAERKLMRPAGRARSKRLAR